MDFFHECGKFVGHYEGIENILFLDIISSSQFFLLLPNEVNKPYLYLTNKGKVNSVLSNLLLTRNMCAALFFFHTKSQS